MTKEIISLFGRLTKTHGYQGKIVLKANLSAKLEIENMESVFLKIDGILVPFFIEEISESNFPFYILKLENIDSDNSASKLTGRDVFILDIYLLQEADPQLKLKDIVGYLLKDQHNRPVGEVVDLLEVPGNSLFVVDFNGREILVPIQLELIIDIIQADNIIKMSIPDGITEI